MTIEEKKAIKELKSFINDKDCIYWIGKNGEEAVKIILNLIEKQSKEIEFYKREELGYIAGYEDGKRHKQTAVAIRNENVQYEIIRKKQEMKDSKIEQLQKEIEELKNRIREKIEIFKLLKKYNT